MPHRYLLDVSSGKHEEYQCRRDEQITCHYYKKYKNYLSLRDVLRLGGEPNPVEAPEKEPSKQLYLSIFESNFFNTTISSFFGAAGAAVIGYAYVRRQETAKKAAVIRAATGYCRHLFNTMANFKKEVLPAFHKVTPDGEHIINLAPLSFMYIDFHALNVMFFEKIELPSALIQLAASLQSSLNQLRIYVELREKLMLEHRTLLLKGVKSPKVLDNNQVTDANFSGPESISFHHIVSKVLPILPRRN